MHAFLRSVCNVISYTTQDDRGSRLLRQNKTSVFTNNSDNVSLRLFYNSLPLPRMWFVLVSMAGWTAGVTALFVRALAQVNGTCWDMGHWSIPPPLFEVMASQNARFLYSCAQNVYCDDQGKYNTWYMYY